MKIELELVKNCDQKKHFLLNRIENTWKKLLGEVVHASNVNSFKSRFIIIG
jgi:hypothetical protein